MSRFFRSLRPVAAAAVAASVGVLVGVIVAERFLFAFVPPRDVPEAAEGEFQLIAEAWNMIDRFYVDRSALQPRRLAYGSISGMVDSLGDTGHSSFLTPEMRKQSVDQLKGHFEGIGAELRMKNGRAVIVAPMDGSPAQKAGLRPGDIILKVDGADVSKMALQEIVTRILGPAGTRVTLTVLTGAAGKVREVEITRGHITLHNVTWHRLPGTSVAHVRIAHFSKGVTKALRSALEEVAAQSLSVLLDLRNNPGGLLDEAVATASQFLGEGNVLLEKNADNQTKPVPVIEGGVALQVPMVTLINQGTASGAEIVAGALRDDGRSRLVGETTFGTGTVLNEFPLSDGSALMLAVQEWLTPKGRTIWHHGIEPDVTVALPPDAFPLFPRQEQGLTAAQLKETEDRQLLAGLAALTALSP
jgi:carboxyl-terminal processing protease